MSAWKRTNRFSREAFGGGEAGERLAHEALLKHEALLLPGTSVRVYRGSPEGALGRVVAERGGRRLAVDFGDGLTSEIESRNLELALPPGTRRA